MSKVAIVGPGAMGCFWAALLREKEHDIWLLDKRSDRAKKISESGITLQTLNETRHISIKATSDPKLIGIVDLLVISVKSYDTQAAIQSSIPLVSFDTSVLTLQNGLGNLEQICKVFPQEQVIGGVTSHGATLTSDGHVKHVGGAKTLIGKIDGIIDNRLKYTSSLLNNCGIETEISDDIIAAIWTKLIINAAINPITAILGVKNGELLKKNSTISLLKMVVEESTKVAFGANIKLLTDDMFQAVEEVCKVTSENISSMFQDILKGRRTEISSINEAIFRKAEEVGVEAPVNRLLMEMVKAIEGKIDEGMRG